MLTAACHLQLRLSPGKASQQGEYLCLVAAHAACHAALSAPVPPFLPLFTVFQCSQVEKAQHSTAVPEHTEMLLHQLVSYDLMAMHSSSWSGLFGVFELLLLRLVQHI